MTDVSETPGHGSTAEEGKRVCDRRMLEALVCPQTHAPLAYNAERNELYSRATHLAYPIRGGIPVMVDDEARQVD